MNKVNKISNDYISKNMNIQKKKYTSPTIIMSGINMNTILHGISDADMSKAAYDLDDSDVSISGITVSNDNDAVVGSDDFAKERNFGSGDGPWDSLW
ncbi:MAG: hypothetical protein MJZ41_10770 [Bacteroidaceae bacterium]|nr:hypothetical protein [Bacteroidaceae bacterium]